MLYNTFFGEDLGMLTVYEHYDRGRSAKRTPDERGGGTGVCKGLSLLLRTRCEVYAHFTGLDSLSA